MNMRNRIELIHLLGEELYDTAIKYEESDCPIAGYDIERIASKEAIKRCNQGSS